MSASTSSVAFTSEKRLMLGVLALLAPLPLPFNGVIGWLSVSAFTLVTALFLVRVLSATYSPLRPWVMNVLGLLYLPVLAYEMSTWWMHQQLMRSLTHLILFALVVKLFSLKQERDYWQSLLAIFFLFLAAMGTSVNPAVAIYLLVFLFGALTVLIRFTGFAVLAEHGMVRSRQELKLKRFIGAVGLLVLLSSIPLFAFLPRLRQPYLFGPGVGSASGGAGGGFAGGLTLDTIGSVRTGRSVVLRFSQQGPEIAADEMRFKAATYGRFQRNAWLRGQRSSTPLDRGPDGFFRLGEGSAGSWLEVWQSKGGRELLLPTNALAFDLWVPSVQLDDSGVVFLPVPPTTTFDFKVGLARDDRPTVRLETPASQLDLDDSAVSERMRTLAGNVMGDGEIRVRAERLERYLMSEHSYTLELGVRDQQNPIEEFLFEEKSGHCEYFATAMVLLLRSQGIPARMVSGYLGAEFNPLEGYYIVRQTNAHAWVEAMVDGQEWSVFDPTPPVGRPQVGDGGMLQFFSQAYDYVLFRWDRYVLTFGFFDQLDFLVRARDFLSGIRGWFDGEDELVSEADAAVAADAAETGALENAPPETWRWLVTALVALLGLWWLWRARTPWTATAAYRMLRSELVRRSTELERQPETLGPVDVERRVLASCPDAAEETRRVVRLYIEESFAERRLSDAELAELRDVLDVVRDALRKAA